MLKISEQSLLILHKLAYKSLNSFLICFALGIVSSCATNNTNFASPQFINEEKYKLKGELNENSYQAIINHLSNHKDSKVVYVVDSKGGYTDDIVKAMDAIYSHGNVTWAVAKGGVCYSACAVLGLSASKIDGVLEFHSVYRQYDKQKYKVLGKNEQIQNKLISFGYNQQLIKQFFRSVNIYRSIEFKDGKIINTF